MAMDLPHTMYQDNIVNQKIQSKLQPTPSSQPKFNPNYQSKREATTRSETTTIIQITNESDYTNWI